MLVISQKRKVRSIQGWLQTISLAILPLEKLGLRTFWMIFESNQSTYIISRKRLQTTVASQARLRETCEEVAKRLARENGMVQCRGVGIF